MRSCKVSREPLRFRKKDLLSEEICLMWSLMWLLMVLQQPLNNALWNKKPLYKKSRAPNPLQFLNMWTRAQWPSYVVLFLSRLRSLFHRHMTWDSLRGSALWHQKVNNLICHSKRSYLPQPEQLTHKGASSKGMTSYRFI